MIRVGVPHYINAYPLIYPLEKKLLFNDIEFVFDTPRAINEALLQDRIDVGLVSSIHFMKNLNDLDLVTTLGIGATKKVMSVALFTKKPLQALNGGSIALVNSSETSIALLEVLMRQVWKIECTTTHIPESTPHEALEKFDGFLMIGDRALQMHDLAKYQRIDLATEWYQATHLPFIFALFAAKKVHIHEGAAKRELDAAKANAKNIAEVNSHGLFTRQGSEAVALAPSVLSGIAPREHVPKKGSQFKWLHFALRYAYEWSLKNRETIVEAAFEKVNVPKARLTRYFSTLDYELGKEHMEGLYHFHTQWKSHAIQPAKA